MRLTTPTFMTLLVSLVFAIVGVLAHVPGLQIPLVGAHGSIALLIGYLILLAGVLVRGL